MSEIIAIASDHAGFSLKGKLALHLKKTGTNIIELGTDSEDSVDYPHYAKELSDALLQKRAQKGILICGSGIGMSIAANRFSHIRAALCSETVSAFYARAHNDANVLALGARLIGIDMAKSIVETFLETPFEGGRHQRRLDQLNQSKNGA